ncbi:hypothetical protein AAG906_002555 [Vitis piasezkii]
MSTKSWLRDDICMFYFTIGSRRVHQEMASTCFALQVNGSADKLSISHNFGHLKTSLSDTVKKMSLRVDIFKTIRNTSRRMLDAFVDSVFQFIDQQLFPSQKNFAPVDEIGEAVQVVCSEGRFPVGIYIRNGPNPLFGGLKSTFSIFGSKKLSNTSIFEHSGRYYAVSENHQPQEIDIFTLETLEEWDLNRDWNRPFTSHPKVDLKFNRGTFLHEIAVTQRLIKYDKGDSARIGVMARYGDADSVRWFSVESHCTFHIVNSFEDEQVVIRGCRALDSIIPGLDQGEVKEKNLTGMDFCMDFPLINGEIILGEKKNGQRMKVKYHSFGENSFCTGSAFALKVGSCVEDDGWIVSFVHNENTYVSQTCRVVAALEMGTTPPAVPASTVSHGWLVRLCSTHK